MRRVAAVGGLLILLNGCQPFSGFLTNNRPEHSLYDHGAKSFHTQESQRASNNQNQGWGVGEGNGQLGRESSPTPLWLYEKRF